MPAGIIAPRKFVDLMRCKSSMTDQELVDARDRELKTLRRKKVVERLVHEIRRRDRLRWNAVIASLTCKTGFHPRVMP
jgi:hypothetical protein